MMAWSKEEPKRGGVPGFRIGQVQLSCLKHLSEPGQELASEQRGNRLHGKEELSLFGRAPLFEPDCAHKPP
jgi:hypothetical protein